ncbi:serine/threonine-protein kinase 36 isoform X1 [Nothobranchius furzeri]|uniref:non-specific serine/threonine protein kinase n=1 Tax=Nothobranchius furzeri TaxID=105023 RepID=A0A9D2XPC3_NOTFU|nr:transcript variant X1 [Nothobranchius furzeri]
MNSYDVLELVGEGSFGRVYKGRKKFTGQVVALKFMPKVDRSEKELRSLKREIEIMRGLQHPYIVQFFDSFETETEVVVVTEYAEGQLFQILEDDGHLPEIQVREIACQLVSALYYLHSHRILHRDMKPQNILLGKNGMVKLCDFGFARAISVSTLVLTSIKGTPLYMSPELVQEKPYDHTADLWSLGCILYELHTGAPPFYTNSIFHLVQLIVRDQIKWPHTMSDTCMSFLKGLLTKDPQKRLSWPHLLHHPFVADGVLVLSEENVFNPLTVLPSPDMLALKLKQVAEKSLPGSGESRLLRKVREQMASKRKPVDEKEKNMDENQTANTLKGHKTPLVEVPEPSDGSVSAAAKEKMSLRSQDCTRSKQRGQISRDYEQEFPSVEIGPRVVRRSNKDNQSHRQDVDRKEMWENLVQESDPSGEQTKRLNYGDIISQIKSEIAAFQAQLTGGVLPEVQRILPPLKVLRHFILTPETEKLHHISRELELPHILFDLIRGSVENSSFIKHQQIVPVLGEISTLLLIYWENHSDWVEEVPRLEEFTRPFITILHKPNLLPVAPVAASILSLFTQHDVDVFFDLGNLTSLLKTLLLDSYKPQISLPSGWGVCDGLLSLLLHTLHEQHEDASVSPLLDPVVFVAVWKKIDSSLRSTTPKLDFFSANGLYSFLCVVLFFFTKDPHSCVPLFTKNSSTCVHTLGRLLAPDCLRASTYDPPGNADIEPSFYSLSSLSCHLLCFPFALDLPSHTTSTVLQLYDSCGIVSSLLQVIQTLPPALLELPLSLLSRLLLCDAERSVSHLGEAASGFFSLPQDGQTLTRTASSLLSELLQINVLWDSAVELLNLLSHVARCSRQPACPQVHVESSVLQRALTHSYDQIKAATCRFLGNLDLFRPSAADTLQLDVFKHMIDCLNGSCMPMRRMACKAVGNWLGCIASGTVFKTSWSFRESTDTPESHKKKQHKEPVCSRTEAATGLATKDHNDDEMEGRRWTQETKRAAVMLASLLSDPDAVTRRHSCAALGNLVHVDGAVSVVLETDICSLLLRAACTDSHNAVRQAAVRTLDLFRQQDATRQVLISLDANEKLSQASHQAPPQRDCQQLPGKI